MIESPPTRLYKYVVPDRIDVLENLRIRFTQAAALNDPFELMAKIDGIVPANEYEKHLTPTRKDLDEALRRHYQTFSRSMRRRVSESAFVALAMSNPELVKTALAQTFQQSIPMLKELEPKIREQLREGMRTQLGILSLTESPTSVTQWAYYAANGKGLAFEFDTADGWFDRRRSPNDECFHLRRVRYLEEEPKALIDLSDELLVTKGVQWQHEREWRMIAPIKDSAATLDVDGDKIHLFDIPSIAISAVVFGYAASPATRVRVSELLKSNRHLHHVVVKTAELEPDSHEVVIKPSPLVKTQ